MTTATVSARQFSDRLSIPVIAVLFVAVLFLGFRLPVVASDFPNWYHSLVEQNTLDVAESMVNNGHPYELPVTGSGGFNIHGILGAPVVLLDFDDRLVRLVSLAAGAVTMVMVWRSQTLLNSSFRTKVTTATLLAVMPHFVLFNGLALPQATGIMFGAVSLYFYLRWRTEKPGARFAALSAVFAGLGAFSHFDGLIIGATIFALLLVEMAIARRLLAQPRELVILGGGVLLAMVPAIALWYARDSRGALGHYEKYKITESGDLLFSAGWWRTQIHYTAEYQPIFIIIGAIVLFILVKSLLAGNGRSGIAASEATSTNPVYFWGIWFLMGLPQLFLLPFGAEIHEYYAWWAVVPAVPLFIALVERVWRERQAVQTGMVVGVVLLSMVITSAQVSRNYGATNIPLLCRYQDC